MFSSCETSVSSNYSVDQNSNRDEQNPKMAETSNSTDARKRLVTGPAGEELPPQIQNPSATKSVLNLIQQLKSMIYSNETDEESVGSVKVSDIKPTRPRRTYTREYLIWCQGFEASNRYPPQMSQLLYKFPKIIKPYGNSGRIRLFPATNSTTPSPKAAKPTATSALTVRPSVLDSLPLLPTAHVYTMDPETKLWEPRARPVEPREKKFRRRRYQRSS
jgi:hypothetical protein